MNKTQISNGVGMACCAAVAVLPLAGCSRAAQDKMVVIRWQRLVNEKGETCDRCGNTEHSIDEAQRVLAASLRPLGMQVKLEKKQITLAQFKSEPSESNRIWIGDTPLEKILDAKTGDSPCCGTCGDNKCRTVIVDGRTYETIPPELIVRAGLRVAADLVQPAAPVKSCCPSDDSSTESGDSDLQPMPWLSKASG